MLVPAHAHMKGSASFQGLSAPGRLKHKATQQALLRNLTHLFFTYLPMWRYRERLNYYEKLRRSLYEILRDALERRLMKISLIDSFYRYQENQP